jgi:spore coat polysaccharide biosynthesis protein SpsF
MNAIIIQARMGSSRFPGKVLMEIIDQETILHYVIKQVKFCKMIDKIIVATTTLPEDDKICDVCSNLSIECFRGNEENVLDRYYQCAKKFSISNIVRIPADKPLIDPKIVDKIVEVFDSRMYDYVTNFLPSTVPQGTEVEIISFEAIEKAWKNAVLPSDKEHVTKYVYTHEKEFKIFNVKNEKDFSEFRWAVDEVEDLKLIKEIVNRIKKRPIHTEDIIQILENEPQLKKINQSVSNDTGYLKSLKNDGDYLK